MNKSLIANAVLAVAIIVLYILHFTGKQNVKTAGPIKVTPRAIGKDSGKIDVPIAYVDMDSLNEKITYIKKMRKQFETEQAAIENEWESGYRNLENQKNSFLQKGSSITQAEAEAFQEKLYAQKQQIDSKKEAAMQKFGEKSGKFLEEIHDKLKKYIASYNEVAGYRFVFASGKDIDYILYKDSTYNITDDIVAGMNDLFIDKK
jgi:outer membrane protein